MKECTDKERRFLDLIIGQPECLPREDGDEIIKLMNEIRFGNIHLKD